MSEPTYNLAYWDLLTIWLTQISKVRMLHTVLIMKIDEQNIIFEISRELKPEGSEGNISRKQ